MQNNDQPPSPSGEREATGFPKHTCGGAMSRNPHPDAGKPGHTLTDGCVYECIPCTVKSRHEWAQRALKAEAALREHLAPSPGIDAAEQKPVAWLIDWPDEPDLGHYFAEEPSPTARSRALVLADVAPPAAQPSAQWLAEAERLIDQWHEMQVASDWHDEEGSIPAQRVEANDKAKAAQALMLAHLQARP